MLSYNVNPKTFVDQAMSIQGKREDELPLLKAWRNKGDVAARDRLLEMSTWVIALAAQEYTKNSRKYDRFYELVMEGQIEQIERLEKFDLSKENDFSAYIGMHVRGKMLRYARKNFGAMVTSLDPKVTLADGTRKRVKFSIDHADASLSDSVGKEDGGLTLGDTIADLRYNPSILAEQRELLSRIGYKANKVPEKKLAIFEQIYMEDRTLTEVGKDFNMSAEGARQAANSVADMFREAVGEPLKHKRIRGDRSGERARSRALAASRVSP